MDLPNHQPNDATVEPARHTSPYASPTTAITTNTTATGYNTESFYSTQGRIGRVRYIAYGMLMSLILTAIFMMALVVFGLVAGLFGATANMASGDIDIPLIIAVGLAYLILIIGQLYISIVPAKRRLNDLNQSGWLALVMLVPLINLILWLYLLFAPGTDGVNDYGLPAKPPSTPLILVAIVLPIISILFIAILAAIALPAYEDYLDDVSATQMEIAP